MYAFSLAILAVGILAGKTAEAVGWRHDGTGRFPKVSPPIKWSKDENVLWKTRMPGNSFGSPIVVGERIFVVSDPAELLCLNVADGAVLWKKTNSTVEVFGQTKARAIAAQYGDLEKERRRHETEHNKLRKEKPDAKEELTKLRQKIKDAEKAIQELQKKFPRKESGGGAGNTAATPASDGKHVAAVFGNGIVAVYTLDGKRLWIKFLESPVLGFGHSASPIVLNGKLIVHFKDLVALDLATGKELWRTPLSAAHASPLRARLGKEDCLITPTGAIVRASDGKVLLKGKWNTSESTPILDNGILYVSESGGLQAIEISQGDEEEIVLKKLWKGDGSRGRRTPSSVLHDGLLYGVNTDGFLDVNDTKTGDLVYRQRLPLQQVYSSATVGGGRVHVFDTRGKTVVLKPGRKYERLALNQLEGTGACPVFVGNRLFIRCQQHLYCLAKKGEEGKESPR
jgi:outer membrane protein assembly factor BamB